MLTEREKWNSAHLPNGYPTRSSIEELNNVIQDLSDERYQKTQNGKLNKIWEQLVSDTIQSGRAELMQRTQMNKKEMPLFSMDNPLVYIGVFLLLAAIAYIAYRLGWPLLFT